MSTRNDNIGIVVSLRWKWYFFRSRRNMLWYHIEIDIPSLLLISLDACPGTAVEIIDLYGTMV